MQNFIHKGIVPLNPKTYNQHQIKIMKPPKPKKNQINIELTEEVADGTYSNLAIITHSNSEFVIDFVKVMPGVPKAKVKSRILLTPQHAKRLFKALGGNLAKFESLHGKIQDIGNDSGFPPIYGGGGPPTQA